MPEIKKAGAAPSAPVMQGKTFDLESILPLATIRQHTKTDDVPHVTDDMLSLYRKAAFEACEEYTGLILRELRVVTEALDRPMRNSMLKKMYYTHTTQHMIADDHVWVYGGRNATANMRIAVTPGTSRVRVPVDHFAIDTTACCGTPCAAPLNFHMQMMYRAGYGCIDAIPAGIKLGCLKFIAWAISNPGDIVMTVRNREGAGEAGIIGTNNGAWASGAIEQWRIHVADAV